MRDLAAFSPCVNGTDGEIAALFDADLDECNETRFRLCALAMSIFVSLVSSFATFSWFALRTACISAEFMFEFVFEVFDADAAIAGVGATGVIADALDAGVALLLLVFGVLAFDAAFVAFAFFLLGFLAGGAAGVTILECFPEFEPETLIAAVIGVGAMAGSNGDDCVPIVTFWIIPAWD